MPTKTVSNLSIVPYNRIKNSSPGNTLGIVCDIPRFSHSYTLNVAELLHKCKLALSAEGINCNYELSSTTYEYPHTTPHSHTYVYARAISHT